MAEPAHGLIVLAAGASTRLGQSKQLLTLHGETLVRRSARVALATEPCDAVIVLGSDADSIYANVAHLPLRRVDCPDWRMGMGASLRSGLDALSKECASALVVVCDQFWLDSSHLQSLCAAWRGCPENASASFYAGRIGVPAILPRRWFAELPTTGDRGASALLEAHREHVVLISNEALAIDIDRPRDMAEMERIVPHRFKN